MMSNNLNVAFLWHMHQPEYRDPVTGEASLPWVRLHACSGYNDMLAMARRYPAAGMVINITPVLLDQLAAYADGTMNDLYLELARIPAGELTEVQTRFIVENFFHCNYATQVEPYPRYRMLWSKRELYRNGGQSRLRTFFTKWDITDLQVWFNLAWMGWSARTLPQVAELFAKGGNFTREEKEGLLDLQLELTRSVLGRLKTLAQETASELSFTPFYHPIAPLLCDTDAGSVADPAMTLPRTRFSHPEDCEWHIREGKRLVEGITGGTVRGMWPGEGSISPQAVALFGRGGVEWVATDEGNLYRSDVRIGDRSEIHRPYRVEGIANCPALLFRQRDLSDAIGFRYQKMTPEDAVTELIGKLDECAGRIADPAEYLYLMALDGENPWGYFPDWGEGFMDRLLSQLERHERLRIATVTNYLDSDPPMRTINRLHSGSWINSDFHIWIGDPLKNRAWELLAETRRFIGEVAPEPGEWEEQEAWRHLHIAEGSDWFWWYGEPNNAATDPEFDRLFRGHLQQVYQLLDAPVPPELYDPIGKKGEEMCSPQPRGMISPAIDGRITSYFEWLGAGVVDRATELTGQCGDYKIERVHYGGDSGNLYIRIEFNHPADIACREIGAVRLVIAEPKRVAVRLWGTPSADEITGTTAVGRIIETAVPLATVEIRPGGTLAFHIELNGGAERHRFPRCGSEIRFRIPEPDDEPGNWIV